jgi:hypothetical protein
METRAVLAAYCRLMESIKARTGIMHMLATNQAGLPASYVTEFQQLQIRMICETLAIACLLAHRDIAGARSARLNTAYQADLIMNALEKIHPRFYPHATRQILKDGTPVGIEDIKDGFLTKDELLKSYHSAGDFLHAGDMTNFLSNRQKAFDPKSVGKWVRKLTTLLNHHSIFLADRPGSWDGKERLKFLDREPAPKLQIIVQMNVGPHGRPEATIFESIGQVSELPEGLKPTS